MRSFCPPRYGMTRCPHQQVSCLGKSVWRRESKHVPPVSAPDFALDPESAERRMSDGKRRPPPLSDSLFHQPLPPAGKPADIVVPLLGPNNDAPPTLVNAPS